jgi:hypothetical protein
MAAALSLGVDDGGGGVSLTTQAPPSSTELSSTTHEGRRPPTGLGRALRVSTIDLLAHWGVHAQTLRTFGATAQAEVLERCVMELERALTTEDGELLTLQRAAQISGYSADHLGRLIRRGALRNLGRPRAPRVRRGELPRKATALPEQTGDLHLVGADPRQVARAVVASRKGER